jgi:predicted transcriptional regulator
VGLVAMLDLKAFDLTVISYPKVLNVDLIIKSSHDNIITKINIKITKLTRNENEDEASSLTEDNAR